MKMMQVVMLVVTVMVMGMGCRFLRERWPETVRVGTRIGWMLAENYADQLGVIRESIESTIQKGAEWDLPVDMLINAYREALKNQLMAAVSEAEWEEQYREIWLKIFPLSAGIFLEVEPPPRYLADILKAIE